MGLDKTDIKTQAEKQVKKLPIDSMLTPGDILRTYREKKNISLKEISDSTKIPIEALEHIEKNDFGTKEDQVFVRGFIKNYSDYLKLDTERILAIYRRSVAMLPNKQVKHEGRKKFHIDITPMFIGTVISVGAIAIILLILIVQIIKFQRPPSLTLLTPENNQILNKDLITVEGKTDPSSTVKVNDEIISIGDTGSFKKEIQLHEGINTIIVKAYKNNNETRSTTITRNVTYNKDSEVTENATPTPTPIEQINVRVEITGEAAWITLIGDGKQLLAQVAPNGYNETFAITSSFELVTGKPKSTQVYINDEKKDLIINTGIGTAHLNCEVKNEKINCM